MEMEDLLGDKSILDDFVTEAKEHLETVEEVVLSLEKQAGSAGFIEAVNLIFRVVHTIKGTAGFVGLTKLQAVAHAAETLLSMLRAGELTLKPGLVDALLAAIDSIRSMVDDVANSNSHNITEVVARLDAFILGGIRNVVDDVEKIKNQNADKVVERLDAFVAASPSLADDTAGVANDPSMESVFAEAKAAAEETAKLSAVEMPERANPLQGEKPAFTERRGERADFVDRRQETIRIKLSILDELMQLAGELVLVRNQQLLSEDRSNPNSRANIQRLDIVTSELQETIMATRMQPIGNLFNRFTRVVRDLGNKLGKQIELDITGSDVELDNTILEALADPMTHLVRNSCDHGIELPADRVKAGKKEAGKVNLRAYHRSGQINIEMSDDGKGINPAVVRRKALEKGLKTEAELAEMPEKDIVSLILLPGFSTAEQLSDVSGRGVGMDVVKTGIERLGGTLDIDSQVGKGTTVHMRLPLTLAIIPCLIVMVGKYRYAIPQVNLEELVCLYDEDVATKIECAGDTEVYRLRDKLLPIVRIDEVLKRPKPFTAADRSAITEDNRKQQEKYLAQLAGNATEGASQAPHSLNFIVVNVVNHSFGLVVDKVIGTEEIVVKPVHPAVKSLGCYAGSTVMGDGRVALILDVQGVARHAGVSFDGGAKEAAQDRNALRATDMQRVLLFKSGPAEQLAAPLSLIKRIEAIKTENIERIGGREYITIEGQSTLILRPDKHLAVSPAADKKEMFLIIPRMARHPFGVLVSQLLDTIEAGVELNTDSYAEEGLLGTAIIKDKMTLFLDIDTLIRKAEPAWFPAGGAGKTGGKILLVEDSPFYRRLVKKYLEAEGYEVAEAGNGQEGLAQLDAREFDLVISDIQMPVMDGLTFIRNLRAGSRQKGIPAIALTALNNDRDRVNAKDAGFNHYELKMSRDQLLASVAELMDIGAGNRN
ncbi:MAG: chemotaxis protein CheW [Nitrospinae bacterium]|nr:chemotaxis protein CheW [Nitrospinota bacterium]